MSLKKLIGLLAILLVSFYTGYISSNYFTNKVENVPVYAPEVLNDIPNFIDDRNIHTTSSPIGASFPGGMGNVSLPTCRSKSKCMVGCNPCYPICSGEENKCLITAPVPSPAWQPQSASAVQERMQKGDFVPASCPTGPIRLQKAPECSNYIEGDSDAPKQVMCYTSKHIN